MKSMFFATDRRRSLFLVFGVIANSWYNVSNQCTEVGEVFL